MATNQLSLFLGPRTEAPRVTPFEYTPLPSTAQFMGGIMKGLAATALTDEDNWNSTPLQDSFFAKIIPPPNFLKGMGFYPLYLCSLPVTIVADVVIGLFEIAYCAMNGLAEDQIKLLAYRKLVISPVQQLTYLVSALAFHSLVTAAGWEPVVFQKTPILNSQIGLISALFLLTFACNWNVGHMLGEFGLDILPNIFKDRDFDVFTPTPPVPTNEEQWNSADNFWATAIRFDQLTTEVEGRSETYINVREKIAKRCTYAQLLGLPSGYTEDDVKAAYKRLAKVFHPDKNSAQVEEAAGLFKCVAKAADKAKEDIGILPDRWAPDYSGGSSSRPYDPLAGFWGFNSGFSTF